ncbi:UBA domain-containing protein 3 [Cucumis melo]|uniref:UBA domain-containing protein 3 n=1 Tax=Cucumis melo TaxID=3656 RepID=A0A1S3CR19_CUCME|nr:UBA domain-containing protein 3 [Cucumis melo]XP_008466360.2 UBA domain-containing protein 3 [Cucumis melo]XP_050939614.1 UBA domain-containing protein 3 [Cucumis melo]
MASRVKEEERIERTLRNLLKLPENRRCINCNSLGPQYVCTTFLTFVCTNCSGVHREFTHRVKSVSMAKFTAEEVVALQAAGNQRAREIYLKTWDPQRHSYPENSDLHRLRNFIKHVYVDRKYSGERGVDELPRLRLTEKDTSQERRKVAPYCGGLQNLQVEMPRSSSKRETRSPIFYYDERSSPRYSKENNRYGGYRRSFTRIEVVDDRIKDDKPGICRLSNGDSKAVIKLSRSQENLAKSSFAVEFNNKVTTGKKEPTRRVEEDARTNKGIDAGGSDQNVVCVNPVETKRDNIESLIDLSISSEPSDATAASSQTQQMPPSNNDNWNAFEPSSTKSTSTAPNANTLEALLFELTVPSTGADKNPTDGPANACTPATPSGSTLTPDFTMGQTVLPISVEASVAETKESVALQTSNASPPQLTSNKGGDIGLQVINGQQLPSTQQKQIFNYPSADFDLNSQLMTPAAVPNFEWTSSSGSNAQGYSSVSTDKIVAADSKPAQGATIGVGSQPPSLEKSSSTGRKELPLDLFTANYPQVRSSHPGWQTGTQHVMGQNLQYYPTPVAARPTNPFDLDDEKSKFYPQSARASMPPLTGLTERYGYQPEAQYSGTYVGQQVYGSIPSLRPQGVGNFGSSSFPSPFGSFNNTTQQPSSRSYPAPNNTNPTAPSFRNNPFG